jgi:hypothetical protein
MTQVLVAGLVVAWLAIALLALGYAGLVRKVGELQTRGATMTTQVYPDLAATAANRRTVALALSRSCPTCEVVFDAWLDIAARLMQEGHRAVVISMDGSPEWSTRGAPDVLRADELSAPLLIAYQPALILLDGGGAVVSAEPVGSAETLRAMCAPLTQPLLNGAMRSQR